MVFCFLGYTGGRAEPRGRCAEETPSPHYVERGEPRGTQGESIKGSELKRSQARSQRDKRGPVSPGVRGCGVVQILADGKGDCYTSNNINLGIA